MISLRRLVPWLSASAALAAAAYVWPFTVDDAFIPCRYAENLALGRGLAWNPGEQAQGVTSLAWTLFLALGRLAGIHELPLLAKGAGLVCAALVVFVTVRRAGLSVCGTRVAVLTASASCTSLSLLVYAVAGLETTAFTLAVTVAALEGPRHPLRSGLAAGAAATLRPEGALVLVVLVLYTLLRAEVRRQTPRLLAAALGPVVATLLVQIAAFGSVVPDTFFARAAPAGAGLEYLLGALVPTGAVLLWPLALGVGWRNPKNQLPLVMVAALLVGVGWEGGDWMPGWRFLVPVWPLTGFLAARGALRLRLRLGRGHVGKVPEILLVAAALMGLSTSLVTLPEVRAAGLERQRAAPRLVRELERLSVRHVALVDVGYVGWALHVRTTDLAGLTDRHIARTAGRYLDKRIDERYLASRGIDAIVLHARDERGLGMFPVERNVARMATVASGFRLASIVRRAPEYVYLILVRGGEAVLR